MSIILNRNQTERLLAMFSTEISDEEITICNDPVRGLLAWYTELPEEGSFELDSESIAFEAKSLAHVEGLEAAKEFEVEGSLGKVTVRPEQRFWLDDVWWEIVANVGHGMYSPVGLGGTAVVTCKLISGEPDKRFSALKDGLIDWCGDSLATAVISYQRRVAWARMKEPEPTAELMSRVVDGVSVATSPRMVANAKRFNTPHAVEHDWTIACHAPPKCKRLEIPIEDEETGADSPKWLPWKLSPDSDPAERWILVSAENDEIEHPANEKYDTEAQAWIACERESK